MGISRTEEHQHSGGGGGRETAVCRRKTPRRVARGEGMKARGERQ